MRVVSRNIVTSGPCKGGIERHFSPIPVLTPKWTTSITFVEVNSQGYGTFFMPISSIEIDYRDSIVCVSASAQVGLSSSFTGSFASFQAAMSGVLGASSPFEMYGVLHVSSETTLEGLLVSSCDPFCNFGSNAVFNESVRSWITSSLLFGFSGTVSLLDQDGNNISSSVNSTTFILTFVGF